MPNTKNFVLVHHKDYVMPNVTAKNTGFILQRKKHFLLPTFMRNLS